MADEKMIAKIQRVYFASLTTTNKYGKSYRYEAWRGWYWLAGTRKTIYLGKELPESLRGLVGKRQFKRLNGNPDWPSSIRRARRFGPGADQVANG